MNRLKRTLKIISTNWIHLVGFYVTTYFSLILFNFLGLEGYTTETWTQTFFLNLIMILYLIFGYGLMFLIGLFGALIILDSIGFNLTKTKTNLILFLEWIIIIPPFVTWAFEYDYWLWLTLIISFATTQMIRKQEIEKIKKRATTKPKKTWGESY
jgi:hypothetical protein